MARSRTSATASRWRLDHRTLRADPGRDFDNTSCAAVHARLGRREFPRYTETHHGGSLQQTSLARAGTSINPMVQVQLDRDFLPAASSLHNISSASVASKRHPQASRTPLARTEPDATDLLTESARGFGAAPMSCTGLSRSGDGEALPVVPRSARARDRRGERAPTQSAFPVIPTRRRESSSEPDAAARTSTRGA